MDTPSTSHCIGSMTTSHHGDTNERQGSQLHMVKKEQGKEKQQLTGPEPTTSKSITDPLVAELWPQPASINLFLPPSPKY